MTQGVCDDDLDGDYALLIAATSLAYSVVKYPDILHESGSRPVSQRASLRAFARS